MFVKKLLFQYGFGYVWETQATFIDHKLFIKEFELRMMDIFKQTCFADTTNRNRCFLYNALDRDFTMTKYLNTITLPSNIKAMAQLRLSSHKLMIERGRWKKIVHKDIIFLHCQALEDEYHVVIVCPKYTVIRKQDIKPYYSEKPCMFKFIQLLKTYNTKEIQLLASFIKRICIVHKQSLFD